jgi:hypothetical protein
MSKKKELETFVLSYEEFSDPDVKLPTKFHIRTADGSYLFIKTSKRDVAQQWVDDNYGIGQYSVRSM